MKSMMKLKIPLIIWGLHQGLDQVGMFSHLDEAEMTRKYRKEHDLMGVEPEDLYKESDCPENIRNELKKYFYPSDEDIMDVQVRGIYLCNYIRWDSKTQHENMIQKYDYRTVKQNRTFNPYEDSHSLIYNDIHDYIKYMKFGYSKVLDHAVQEIRLRRISRTEGLELVRNYSKEKMKNLDFFLNYLNISNDEFNLTMKFFKLNHVTINDYEISDSQLKNSRLNLKEIKSRKYFVVNDIAEDSIRMHSFYKGIYL